MKRSNANLREHFVMINATQTKIVLKDNCILFLNFN